MPKILSEKEELKARYSWIWIAECVDRSTMMKWISVNQTRYVVNCIGWKKSKRFESAFERWNEKLFGKVEENKKPS